MSLKILCALAFDSDGDEITMLSGVTRLLLDPEVDTAQAYSDGSVTASVARAGRFRGPALIVGSGTNAVTLADRLRDIGIFVHGPITVPA